MVIEESRQVRRGGISWRLNLPLSQISPNAGCKSCTDGVTVAGIFATRIIESSHLQDGTV